MLVTLLVLVPFGLILAALSLPASRRSRVDAASGGPAVPPAGSTPESGGTAVPVITDAPERAPFAYDNGLKVGGRES